MKVELVDEKVQVYPINFQYILSFRIVCRKLPDSRMYKGVHSNSIYKVFNIDLTIIISTHVSSTMLINATRNGHNTVIKTIDPSKQGNGNINKTIAEKIKVIKNGLILIEVGNIKK